MFKVLIKVLLTNRVYLAICDPNLLVEYIVCLYEGNEDILVFLQN